jgi:hypothetical protein
MPTSSVTTPCCRLGSHDLGTVRGVTPEEPATLLCARKLIETMDSDKPNFAKQYFVD